MVAGVWTVPSPCGSDEAVAFVGLTGASRMIRSMSQPVVIITPDVVGARMAGPGIRAWHIARELRDRFDVVLIAMFQDEEGLELDGIRIERFGSRGAAKALRTAGVVIGQPHREMLRLVGGGQSLIFDLFDPVILELDELTAGLRGRLHRILEYRRLTRALRGGDRLIAATDRQRELYERIAGESGHVIDPARWLIVPFGVPDDAAPSVEKATPPVVIWNGGVWPWLDPQTAVRAIDEVNARGIEATLQFMGTGRPNASVSGALPSMDPLTASRHVEWNSEWVPYEERAAVIGRASISLMLHGETREAEYSIRTRLFDAVWCGIPVIATRGGFAAELVEREGLGIVVSPGDVSGVADAIVTLLEDDEIRSRSVSALMGLRRRYRWSEVCKPLISAVEAAGR